MDDWSELIGAKAYKDSALTNVALWIVEEKNLTKNLSKLIDTGLKYPLLIQSVGDELFLYLSFVEKKERIAITVKTKNPKNLADKIKAKFKGIVRSKGQ